jgi:hypothetical protein
MLLVSERLLVVALEGFGDELFFELADFIRIEERLLGARDDAPFALLRPRVPSREPRRTSMIHYACNRDTQIAKHEEINTVYRDCHCFPAVEINPSQQAG